MDLVAENCNRVGVFAKGKLKAVGTPKQLFSDYESVESAGLYLPLTASLTKLLKDKGVEIDNDFTELGFIKGVVKAFGNKGDEQ
jgi:ABC-type multidrug transport system ATPase subunit